jgi:hypothetical protein
LNHQEYFNSLRTKGCPECQDMDNIVIQRRIEEQINYDEYWSIEDGILSINSHEDETRTKKVIWYVIECKACDFTKKVDDIDITVELQDDWNNTDIQEDVFCKEIEGEN